MGRDRISSICSSNKKQKCITPKMSLLQSQTATNSKLANRKSKYKDKVFVFSQRRTRKSSRSKENRALNITTPLDTSGFSNMKYFNFGRDAGNKGFPRPQITNTLLSPNFMTTLTALKKRNNSLNIVNKFHTLNGSSGTIRDSYIQPQLESAGSVEDQTNDKECEETFYKGVKSLDSGDPKKAITYLSTIVDNSFKNKKMAYIILSIAYRRTGDYNEALKVLSKAITKYPKFAEAFAARGQIYLFLKKWDKAFIDFRKVLQLSKNNGLGLLGQGDSLKGIGNYSGALSSYTSAIEVDKESSKQGFMKRGILYLQMSESSNDGSEEARHALEDFNCLIEMDPENANASFFKAKSLKKLKNYDDAVLCFEQVLKLANEEYLQENAIYEIVKIRVRQRDFYEADYALQCFEKNKFKLPKLEIYQGFIKGVIFLMKRKTKKGVAMLTQIIDNSLKILKEEAFLNSLIYIYRAYGRIIIQEYDHALKDLLKASSIKKLFPAAYYNLHLCIGILSVRNKEFDVAMS